MAGFNFSQLKASSMWCLRRLSGLSGYLVEPSLVRHIELRSAMDSRHEQERDGGDVREYYTNYPL